MTPIFADTSFFVALVDNDDQFHLRAVEFLLSNNAPLFSTSAIILELGAYFSRTAMRPGFSASLTAITNAKVEIIEADPLLQKRGIELFLLRSDKNWSLADCISFIVMGDYDMQQAATTDRHFTEAGFTALLRRPSAH